MARVARRRGPATRALAAWAAVALALGAAVGGALLTRSGGGLALAVATASGQASGLAEAAAALGRSRKYVVERVKAGIIPGKTMGPNDGRSVIDRRGFEAYRSGSPTIAIPNQVLDRLAQGRSVRLEVTIRLLPEA
jgi:hypothetical protein